MGSESLLGVMFWTSLAVVGYAYVGYPLLLWIASRRFGHEPEWPCNPDGRTPFVSVLIAAHNEEAVIGKRLANALAFDYPADRMEVVVASDGSTDRTTAIVESIADARVRLIAYPTNRGKVAVLNDTVPRLRGDIVVLSDANTFIEPFVVRRFVRWFQDPGVGVVCGRLVLTDPATGNNVDSMYWKYETFLKTREGRLDALLGANGAIYAIRRSMFAPLRADTLVDDFVLPLLIKLRTGCRIVYDREAVAHETSPAEIAVEFRRRSRIGAGDFQSIPVLWRLLSPARGWTAFAFFSHKILRWSCPFLLVTMLASNLALLGTPLYRMSFLAQAGALLLSVLGMLSSHHGAGPRLLRLTTMFTSMNLALLVGFWWWVTGIRGGVWQRTAR